MNEAQDFSLDHNLIRQRFSRRADQVRNSDFLARESSSRMAERLDYIRLEPQRILDLGCGHGADLPMLKARYPEAQCTGLDFSAPLLELARPRQSLTRRLFRKPDSQPLICADARQLPFARNAFQLVWSNLLLNWLTDPLPTIREAHRVLDTGGLLMFATLGPDSLKELREAFSDRKGHHIHRFIDMHDLGDCLVQAGFADPVMDMQTLTLTYPDSTSLWHDMRNAAAGNASTTRPRGLYGKSAWQEHINALNAGRKDGLLHITIELVFGHAWKVPTKQTDDGRSIIQFYSSRP